VKHLRWLPFAFLAGQHGFAIYAPYAALMVMTAMMLPRKSVKTGGAAGVPANLPALGA